MISGFQQLFFADIARLAVGFQCRINARTVVVDDLHAKAVRAALGNALANSAHAQNAQRGTVNVGTGKHVKAPLGPLASAQIMLTFSDATSRRHHQRKAKVGGGFGQHIGRIGGQHARGGHGVDVKVVITHGHVGADFEVGTSCQHLGVNPVTTGRESTVLALQALDQISLRPNCISLIRLDLEMLRQALDDFRKNSACDQNFGLTHEGVQVDALTNEIETALKK